MSIESPTQAVSYCGLCCATCGSHRKGKCAGCKSGGGFAKCQARLCARERGYATCAECTEMESCKKLHNFISKLFALVFRSNRKGNLLEIREAGLEAFVTKRGVSIGD